MLGLINLNKPAGMSSARAVGLVKRLLPRKFKVGHAGTLDPFATGVLLVLVGKATKWSESLMSEPKQYDATIRFGANTETDDPTSLEIPYVPTDGGTIAPPPDRAPVEAAIARLIGTILQRPPAFSALKVDGQRAYQLARKGREVQLAPRSVCIYGIEFLDYDWPELKLRIDCGRGTYIRAIARDLGDVLRVGGFLTALRRTRVGRFTVADAISPGELTSAELADLLQPYGANLGACNTQRNISA